MDGWVAYKKLNQYIKVTKSKNVLGLWFPIFVNYQFDAKK